MTKKTKRIVTSILTMAVSLTLLTGCGGQTESTDASIDDVTTTAADATETEDTASDDASSEIPTLSGNPTLTYIGHASVKIVASDGTVLYIDPNYYAGDYSDPADYVLVTHCHDDHQPHKDVTLKDGGQLITYKEALHDGTYETYDFGNIKIEAVAAGGNANHSIDSCIGYIVTVDGISVYHAGDTSMIDQMKELTERNIDYAMYPIDGIYNMNATEATEVANLVAARNSIPIHEFDDYGKKKSDKFLPENRLVLEYGETIELQ